MFLLAVAALFSQAPSFGVKAGIPLTNLVEPVSPTAGSTTTNRYLVGGTIEVRLSHRLGLELDGLYRHLHFSDLFLNPPPSYYFKEAEHVTTGAWEFPLVLKYHPTEKVAGLYVSVGPTCDALQGLKNSFAATSFTPLLPSAAGTNSSPIALQNTAVAGFSAGAGLALRAGAFRLSPEIRYTRWISPHFADSGLTNSQQNQAEFLVGFTF